MSFFDDAPPPPPEPTHDDCLSYVAEFQLHQPAWMEPPEGSVGGTVQWRIVLDETDDHAIILSDFVAYTTGVRFTMLLRYLPGALGVLSRWRVAAITQPFSSVRSPSAPANQMFEDRRGYRRTP